MGLSLERANALRLRRTGKYFVFLNKAANFTIA